MGMINVVQKGRRQVVTDTFGRPFMDVPVAERRRCITGHHLRHVIEGIVRGITGVEIKHCYGGSRAATTNDTMLLPRLPQNWLFTVREQYTILGYAVHEICHHLYTKFEILETIFPGLDKPGFKATNPQKHLKAFWNAIEDYRIEKICRSVFPGFPNYIDVTRDHTARKFLERVENGEYSAAKLSNAFHLGAVAVTWSGAELNLYRTQMPSLALQALNPKLRDWVLSWSPDLAKVSVVMDSLDLAQQMVDDLYRQKAGASVPETDEEQPEQPPQDDEEQPTRQDDDQQSDDQTEETPEDGQDADEAGDPGTTSADDDRAGGADADADPKEDDADGGNADGGNADDQDRSDTDGSAEGDDDGHDTDGIDKVETGADEDQGGDGDTGPGEDVVEDAVPGNGEEDHAKDGQDPLPTDADAEDDGAETSSPDKDDDANGGGRSDDGDASGTDDGEQATDGPDDDASGDAAPDDASGQDPQTDLGDDDGGQPADGSASDDVQNDAAEHDDFIGDDPCGSHDDPAQQPAPDTSQNGTESSPTDDARESRGNDASDDKTDGGDTGPSESRGGGQGGGQQASASTDDECGDDSEAGAGGGAAAPDGTFEPEEPEDLSNRDLDFDDSDGDEGRKPPRPGLDMEENDDEDDPEASDLDIDDIRKALEGVKGPEAEDVTSVAPEDIGQSTAPKGESEAERNLRRDAVARAGAEQYAALRGSLGGPAMRSAGIVRRMLQSRGTTRIARGREEGDLDFERVVGMALGDSSIYKQVARKIQVNTAISLLLDNSYSMNGHALAVCQQTAIVLDQSVTGTRTAIEITGFTSDFMTGKVRLYQYRTFEQKGNAAAASLGNMTSVEKGGTPVAVPIYDAVRRLTPRPEERRLMIVVSDGEAEDPSESADAYAIAESMGITVVGISIGSPHNLAAMRQWCRIAHGIADIEELPQALTQIVQEILR